MDMVPSDRIHFPVPYFDLLIDLDLCMRYVSSIRNQVLAWTGQFPMPCGLTTLLNTALL